MYNGQRAWRIHRGKCGGSVTGFPQHQEQPVSDPEPNADLTYDDLFRLARTDFTSARNALERRLRHHDPDAAARIKALRRPSVSAWAVNQLWWRERGLFAALLAAGEDLRGAQLRGAPGAQQQALSQARRNCLTQLTAAAQRQLAATGHPATTATLRKVTTTLEACAAYGTQLPEHARGHLCEDLAPPGFERLADFAPMPNRPSATDPQPDTEREALARIQEARAAVERAQALADNARQQHADAVAQTQRCVQVLRDAERTHAAALARELDTAQALEQHATALERARVVYQSLADTV